MTTPVLNDDARRVVVGALEAAFDELDENVRTLEALADSVKLLARRGGHEDIEQLAKMLREAAFFVRDVQDGRNGQLLEALGISCDDYLKARQGADQE